MSYTPNAVDLLWAQNVVAVLRDNGALAYPATKLMYRLRRPTKVLELTNPEELQDPESRETHERTVIVFNKIGWKVEVRP